MPEPAVSPGHADIVGQEEVCERLWGALEVERVHHCYLFEGPEGVGKATVALRFAMAANCESPSGPRPCTRCGPCQLIAAGRHPDVIRVCPDREKTTEVITVEQAREVIRVLALHRHSARRRFVLVDPADLLRVEATNALLKTFEEPPPFTTFLLITNRAGALLPTVLSRSFRVRFRTVGLPALEEWLSRRGVDEPSRVARLAFGSPGHALGLAEGRLEELDQACSDLLLALSGGTMSILAYAEKVGASPRTTWEKRMGLALDTLEMLLRDAGAIHAGWQGPLLAPANAEVARRWARSLGAGGLDGMDRALHEARARLQLNVSPRTVAEALLTRLAVELGPEGRKAGT